MLFQIFNSGFEGMTLFAVIVAYVLALLFALSSHEFAHAYVAYRQGDNTPKLAGRLTLNPLAHLDFLGAVFLLLVGFGWAKPVECNPLNFRKYKSGIVKVSIAGVVTNLITAILFSLFYVLALNFADLSTTFGIFLVKFCEYMCMISFVLAVFNILPIPPLDGFSLLSAFVRRGNPYITFMQKYGIFVLLLILITPIFDIIVNFLWAFILSPFIQLWLMLLF